MKSLILDIDNFKKSFLDTKTQIAFSSWKQGDLLPKGTWAVVLVNEGELRQRLGTFELHDYSNKDWTKISPLEWITCIEDNVTEFAITLEVVKNKDFTFVPNFPKNWKFKIYIKNIDESGEGIREPEEFVPTVDYCSNFINILSADKPLGALCPYDPDTKSHMVKCLNWRRVDEIGKACRSIMNKDDRKESIYNFCMYNIDAADCKCINKFEYEDYLSQRHLHTEDDYCWYFPCKSGAYLIDKEGDSIKCYSNNCIISYNNTNVEGNVKLNKNSSSLQCFNSKDTNENYFKKFFLVIAILMVLVILFK